MTDTTTTPTTLPEIQRIRRGHDFYPSTGDELPPLYATEDTATADKTVRVHYFVGGCDWWLVEYDPAEGRAFGYACLADLPTPNGATSTSPNSKRSGSTTAWSSSNATSAGPAAGRRPRPPRAPRPLNAHPTESGAGSAGSHTGRSPTWRAR